MSGNKIPNRDKNPWNKNQVPVKPTKRNGPNLQTHQNSSERKFKEAQQKQQEAAQKYANYESSSSEDELETDNVIGTILKKYEASGGENNLIGRTRGYLEEAFVSGACTCLICISSIKRNEAIWSCTECYCFFHLMCIERWSKDTLMQLKQALEDQIQVRQIKLLWGCPKCRHEYKPDDIPKEYLCFCHKTVNPTFQPLIVPHSCGETCAKDLKPYCGHGCLLLCHPGPCPPCPQTVTISCFCGASKPKTQRCSNKEWSCGSPCNKPLVCGKHKCSQSCHSGACLPCPKKSIQKCVCNLSQKLRDCATPVWQCDKVCNKPLECGYHKCEELCHIGRCDDCVLSKTRTCPCGKSYYQLACTEETPTCGDTCDKFLECGMHVCNQRCHKDKCSLCVETVTKSCRCGFHTKEVACCKLYLCDSKCKIMKDCNKHPCNRKCCDGNCPPCEKPCGRTLSCRKHTCNSVCHRGPCYPCNMKDTVSCRCAATSIAVPCGRKNRTKPPKCPNLCMLPPECHHKAREAHRCHFGECPPCAQTCEKLRAKCSHSCPAKCHSSVLVKIEGQKASTPWEDKGPRLTKKDMPCPACVVPVPVTCLGEHETCNWACYLAKPSSCQKECGRSLSCGNHTCTKLCHTVNEAPDHIQAGVNCEVCENECSKDRPDGCPHKCPKPCHPGNCPPCNQMIRTKCHCGLTQLYIVCKSWTSATTNNDELLGCGNQCPKNFECGHRCRANCHPPPCPNPEQCKKKIKVTCACKRIKKEVQCEIFRKGAVVVECDELCVEKKEEEKKAKDFMDEQKRKEEEIRNLKEVEKYEKLFQAKKKNRERRFVEEVKEDSVLKKYWVVVTSVVVCICGIYFVLK